MGETWNSLEGYVTRKGTQLKKREKDSEIQEVLEKHIKIGNRLKGRRVIGEKSLVDVPDGMARKVLGKFWQCPKCFCKHGNTPMKCHACGNPSPLANINWRR